MLAFGSNKFFSINVSLTWKYHLDLSQTKSLKQKWKLWTKKWNLWTDFSGDVEPRREPDPGGDRRDDPRGRHGRRRPRLLRRVRHHDEPQGSGLSPDPWTGDKSLKQKLEPWRCGWTVVTTSSRPGFETRFDISHLESKWPVAWLWVCILLGKSIWPFDCEASSLLWPFLTCL